MHLRQLETFKAAARAGSFAQAALDLHYAPSTVTEQVRALEASLGTALFVRRGRGVALTAAGERLLPYAERIADLADRARSAVATGATAAGTVTVGGLETLCAFRLPRALAALRRTSPEIRVRVQSATRPELEQALAAGSIDVALTLGAPFDRPGLSSEPLGHEPLALVVTAGHRLAAREEVASGDLAGEPFLVTPVGCSFRALVDRAYAGRPDRPEHVAEIATVGALKRSVLEGLGITLLPEVAVAGELARGELAAVRWRPAGQAPALQVSWHAGREPTPARTAVLERLRAELAATTAES